MGIKASGSREDGESCYLEHLTQARYSGTPSFLPVCCSSAQLLPNKEVRQRLLKGPCITPCSLFCHPVSCAVSRTLPLICSVGQWPSQSSCQPLNLLPACAPPTAADRTAICVYLHSAVGPSNMFLTLPMGSGTGC